MWSTVLVKLFEFTVVCTDAGLFQERVYNMPSMSHQLRGS